MTEWMEGNYPVLNEICILKKFEQDGATQAQHISSISTLIPQIIDKMSRCTLFTKFNVHWGYNNIHIRKGNEWKATFLTPEGLFGPMVMFFSLTNSSATFQIMMNTIFRKEVTEGWLSVYMDNITIHTKPKPGEMEEQHLAWHQDLTHHILDKLEREDLYLKPEKCMFKQKEIDYLGVIVGKGTLHMDPSKIKDILNWPISENPTNIHLFLGFTGFYRYFIPKYLEIVQPLLDLTKKLINFKWGPQQHQAFKELKRRMCSSPVLI